MSFQFVGSAAGVPVMLPDWTPVRVAPVRVTPLRLVAARFAPVRLAPGPMRYPPMSFQLVGNAAGVPVMLPDCTPVNVASVRVASAK